MPKCVVTVDGNEIATRVDIALTSADRSIGLLGRDSIAPEEGTMWEIPGIRKKLTGYWNAIHMVGMKFPIAVIWVDKNGRIVRSVIAEPPTWRNLLGWHSSSSPAAYVIELHPSHLTKLHLGSSVSWKVN